MTMVSYHTLNSLPLAEGASWDPDRTCLPGTRIALLDDIWSWILSDENTSRVFWLTGVAGSGKSAIAHTVAQRCHDHHMLTSSFFFDRNIAGRNEPSKLFSTIARGLAHFDERVAHHISLAIELEQTLATGPISRQFEELIYKPSTRYAGDKPIVIVIDALDEGGYDISLLKIFRDNFPKLHDKFRIFVTSRPGKEIDAFLSQKPHIRAVTIDIGGNSNLEDIQVYSRDRLQEVASRNGLPSDWPGHELLSVNKGAG